MNELKIKIDEMIKNIKAETFKNLTFTIQNKSGHDNIKFYLKSFFPSYNYTDEFTNINIIIKDDNTIEINNINSNIYIHGKYSKMSRNISQTPLKINNELLYENSVSDFIIFFKKHYDSKNVNFIGAGREDADVICHERPFIIEIVEPKRNLENHTIEIKLNEYINIFDLKIITKDYRNLFVNMKHDKIYKLLIYSPIEKLIGVGQYKIKQKTPIRTLHRRPNLIRERNIEILSIKNKDKNYFEMILKSDHGAYIKEFINGDFNRTMPNLSKLNKRYCDLVELDVIKIIEEPIANNFILYQVSLIKK